jgi:hypothetical protein
LSFPWASTPGLSDKLAGASGVAVSDLMREIVPDLTAAQGIETGHLAKALRAVSGASSIRAADPVTLESASLLPIMAEGRRRLLLLADLGAKEGEMAHIVLLGLYEDGKAPRLLDAVDIGADAQTSFASPPLLELSPRNQAVVIENTHSNSNQTYRDSQLFFVQRNRLKRLADVFTFDDHGCGFDRKQKPSFLAVPHASRLYADIRVRVVETVVHTGEDCGEDAKSPPASSRTIDVMYSWRESKKRYQPNSDALGQLAKENETRF